MDAQNQPKTKTGKRIFWCIIMVVLVAVAVTIVQKTDRKEPEPEIITVSKLEKIINVSELSTFTAVYNGIANVMNEKNTTEIDYYVSYEARVDAGIDFEKIEISVDNEAKVITIKLPEVYITNINVNIGSLDFIFLNDQANTSTVTEKAFKACEADVRMESEQQSAIYELAKQNAANVLTALVQPMIEQLDETYRLMID